MTLIYQVDMLTEDLQDNRIARDGVLTDLDGVNELAAKLNMDKVGLFWLQGHILYVQEVVTLQKKYLIYLHQKMRFTPIFNYYDTLG